MSNKHGIATQIIEENYEYGGESCMVINPAFEMKSNKKIFETKINLCIR